VAYHHFNDVVIYLNNNSFICRRIFLLYCFTLLCRDTGTCTCSSVYGRGEEDLTKCQKENEYKVSIYLAYIAFYLFLFIHLFICAYIGQFLPPHLGLSISPRPPCLSTMKIKIKSFSSNFKHLSPSKKGHLSSVKTVKI
jgi:hypothetical protein